MNVVVAGGTGLVGQEILRLLAKRQDVHVTALVRRKPPELSTSPNIEYRIFDFDSAADFEWLSQQPCDVFFCSLGTTIRTAGSKEKFSKVDLEYPSRLLASVKSRRPVFALVSSVGADKPRGFYLNTKAALEKRVIDSGLSWVIVRPSLLLGRRQEFRFFEGLARACTEPFHGLIRGVLAGSLSKYAPVQAADVAWALVESGLRLTQGGVNQLLEGDQILCAEKINSNN
ncbi:NAD-dependent epimerase/dehydratase family protein [bacterium]|nr:NAD-dependent epimerase/dehydratase family protein [bacterium]